MGPPWLTANMRKITFLGISLLDLKTGMLYKCVSIKVQCCDNVFDLYYINIFVKFLTSVKNQVDDGVTQANFHGHNILINNSPRVDQYTSLKRLNIDSIFLRRVSKQHILPYRCQSSIYVFSNYFRLDSSSLDLVGESHPTYRHLARPDYNSLMH